MRSEVLTPSHSIGTPYMDYSPYFYKKILCPAPMIFQKSQTLHIKGEGVVYTMVQ